MEEAWELAVVITLGFDPGGKGAFGCAIVDWGEHSLRTISLTSVDDVLGWATAKCIESCPVAVGIDTILHWQTSPSGWRGADEFLRHKYRDVFGSVQSSNSAAGSMAVQGVALAIRLRDEWPDIMITETHPKVLWRHVTGEKYPQWNEGGDAHFRRLISAIGLDGSNLKNDHEFDAAISAWAASESVNGVWTRDLVDIRGQHQVNPSIFPAGQVSYFWPG